MAALVGYGIVAMAALGYGGPSPKTTAKLLAKNSSDILKRLMA